MDKSAVVDSDEAKEIIYDVAVSWTQNRLDDQLFAAKKCFPIDLVHNDIGDECEAQSIFLRLCLLHPDFARVLVEHERSVFGKWEPFLNISKELKDIALIE